MSDDGRRKGFQLADRVKSHFLPISKRSRMRLQMARSSTTFKPGNRAAVKPGNKLAVRHGAHSAELIAQRLPEIRSQIWAELDEVGYLTRPDTSLVERYCNLIAQAKMREEHWDATGGMWTESGKGKPGFSEYMLLLGNVEKFAKILGLGANPRIQVLQGMANTGKELVLIKAAQERMRARLLDG